jgi:hypothetical protein
MWTMTEPIKSRSYLKGVLILFAALIVIAMAVAAYRYATPHAEADIEAARAAG